MSWNRRSESQPSTECDATSELFRSYLPGEIDEVQAASVEAHLETCSSCRLLLEGDGETLARLAHSIPQRTAPSHLKNSLFGRIESEERSARPLNRLVERWSGYGDDVLKYLSAQSGKLGLAGLAIALILAGAWSYDRLNEISPEQQEPVLEGEGLSARNEALLMSSSPGASVNVLRGTGPGESARGVLVASHTSDRALLLVVDLPPLPRGMVYQVWLLKGGLVYSAGWFTVDSTGYGQTVIIPVAPFWEFDAAGITIEPRGGSIDPTGVSVLSGEL